MKTALFTPCFLEGKDAIGNDRLARNLEYVSYYSKISEDMGIDSIVLYDNASPMDLVGRFEREIPYAIGNSEVDFQFFREPERLYGGGGYNYPYCWRALYFLKDLIDLGFQKFLIIDSDGYVLSPRLAKHIKNLNTGWEALWCKKWQFPDASIQILCEDTFNVYNDFTKGPWLDHNGKCMETSLPFTKINKDFDCDRYGEDRALVTSHTDFYGQRPLDIKMEYRRES